MTNHISNHSLSNTELQSKYFYNLTIVAKVIRCNLSHWIKQDIPSIEILSPEATVFFFKPPHKKLKQFLLFKVHNTVTTVFAVNRTTHTELHQNLNVRRLVQLVLEFVGDPSETVFMTQVLWLWSKVGEASFRYIASDDINLNVPHTGTQLLKN